MFVDRVIRDASFKKWSSIGPRPTLRVKFISVTAADESYSRAAVKNPFGPFNVIRNHNAMSWARAESYCKSLGGNLPLPKSQEENDWLALLGDTQLGVNSATGLSNRDRHRGGVTEPKSYRL